MVRGAQTGIFMVHNLTGFCEKVYFNFFGKHTAYLAPTYARSSWCASFMMQACAPLGNAPKHCKAFDKQNLPIFTSEDCGA